MNMSLTWTPAGRRQRSMLLGLGVISCCALASLVLAPVGFAAAPGGGSKACQQDGKISGRGASYQAHAENYFAELYREDFCGVVEKAGEAQPPVGAGSTMLAYNYQAAEEASATGASAGLKAASCRTDAYAGDSLPYTEAQLAELDGVPGKTGGCTLTFSPPFVPASPYPGPEDTKANIMSFPVAGTATAIIINLTNALCGGTAPGSIDLTATEVSRLFGGDVASWNDPELVANNPALANCTGAVTRVLREDSSGTTEIFKAYLVRAENARTGQKCAEGKKWSNYTAKNTEWPGKQAVGKEGTCSAFVITAKSGGPEEVKKLEETPDGVGYADLPDVEAAKVLPLVASVENATATSPEPPGVSGAANCNYNVLSLPGATASDSVGLDPEDNWATNNEEADGNPNHQNPTDLGGKYPICGLTFDLVYEGLSDTAGTANPISRLNVDQRRTLYSYFSFVLSSLAQRGLTSIYYAPLPQSWGGKLVEGFQANF